MRFVPMLTTDEWDWMKGKTHLIACSDSEGLVAYDDKDTIVACCVADSFTVDACSVHIAIDNPTVIRDGFLNEIARHLFLYKDRKRIFGLIPSNNDKALKFDLHIGFEEVARVPNAIQEGIDYIVVCMERDTCRWLEEVREVA